ncbi:MAG: hypothetical protein Q8O40_13735 [Chloroflexota bacterium]|nr:hypothetical protein [Chloroflexota bacterium]
MNITFVCLANSTKLGGRCVAGIKTDGTGWIRPVSEGPTGTLLPSHYTLDAGREAALLDVVGVEVSRHSPEPHQPENWVIAKRQWGLIECLEPVAAWRRLRPFLVLRPALLGNRTDRIAYSDLKSNPIPTSLALIEPSKVNWLVTTSPSGKRQTRALFTLGGAAYDLGVTDPQWLQRLSKLKVGLYENEDVGVSARDRLLFTISLGVPFTTQYFTEQCFKLVAAVIVLQGIRGTA